ncbi:cytosine deaminase [Leucobacter sp. OH2974_COT-288]|nr:cytosine deaminase [Leucobacter sp. OH2974_COT-288]
MTAAIKVYSAQLVVPVVSPPIPDGAVAVQDGKILHLGDRNWLVQLLRDNNRDFTEEYWEGILTPGLVNAHTHLQYTCMGGVAERYYNGFDDWGDAFDAAYTAGSHDWKAAAATGAQMLLQSGCTAAADVVTDIAAAGALHDAGLRGIAYWEIYGKKNSDWDATQAQLVRQQVQRIPSPPGAGVSPHAPYSLDVKPLLEIPDIARQEGLRLHIHLGEAYKERGLRNRSDDWPSLGVPNFSELRAQGLGVSSTQFVDHLGVLGPDCHIAHGIYMDEIDRAILRSRGTAVALCPRSNEIIGLDMPPVAQYLKEGNLVAVGTDSLSSSPSLELLADVGMLYHIAREQGYGGADLHERLLHAATLGGATALGMHVGHQRIGQLVVGAAADFACFEVPTLNAADGIASLVEDGVGRARRTVIAGTTVWQHEQTV